MPFTLPHMPMTGMLQLSLELRLTDVEVAHVTVAAAASPGNQPNISSKSRSDPEVPTTIIIATQNDASDTGTVIIAREGNGAAIHRGKNAAGRPTTVCGDGNQALVAIRGDKETLTSGDGLEMPGTRVMMTEIERTIGLAESFGIMKWGGLVAHRVLHADRRLSTCAVIRARPRTFVMLMHATRAHHTRKAFLPGV
jgi:hypothetical protein